MAVLTLTNKRGDATIPPTDNNEFPISSLQARRCTPRLYQNVDGVAYFNNVGDGGGRIGSHPLVGDVVYSDAGLTTLLVSSFSGLDPSTHFADFNINKGDFITIGPGSVVINTSCK